MSGRFKLATLGFFLIAFTANSQLNLSDKDFNNLVAMGELFSHDPNGRGDRFVKTLDSLRTPKLSHLADALSLIGNGDAKLLDEKFLSRPSNEELQLWYVFREVHYNLSDEDKKPRPSKDVARETLDKKIDERLLLENYYFEMQGGIATLFNETDLSAKNIELDKLGFKNDTEKAIFFFELIDGLLTKRFMVLQHMSNNARIIEFAAKMPKIDGKPYYSYRNFDFPDFEFTGYKETELYKKHNLESFYNTLAIQFTVIAKDKGRDAALDFYNNSILSEPKYFRFSGSEKDLKELYENVRKK